MDREKEPNFIITMKELDHIQAILGRYDTFFFLMKQVCLAGMAAVFTIAVNNKLRLVPWFTCLIPLVFFVIETGFRYFYWTGYVGRIEEIRDHLKTGDSAKYELYKIRLPRKSYTGRDVWRCPKTFDVIYYVLWAVVGLLAATVLAIQRGSPSLG